MWPTAIIQQNELSHSTYRLRQQDILLLTISPACIIYAVHALTSNCAACCGRCCYIWNLYICPEPAGTSLKCLFMKLQEPSLDPYGQRVQEGILPEHVSEAIKRLYRLSGRGRASINFADSAHMCT